MSEGEEGFSQCIPPLAAGGDMWGAPENLGIPSKARATSSLLLSPVLSQALSPVGSAGAFQC